MDLPSSVRIDEISHSFDLRIVLVWLRLLTVKWIDLTASKHISEHEVLEDLYPLSAAASPPRRNS